MKGFTRRMVLKSGAIRYYPIVLVDGKQKSLGGFKLKKDAEARLKRAEKDLATGTYGREELTLQAFYERWIKAKEKSLKASSLRDVKGAFTVHILPVLGSKRLEKLGPLDVQGFVDGLAEKKLAPATIGKVYRYLRSALRQAESWRLIERAPTSGIILPRSNREELSFLKPEEIVQLLAKAREPERILFAVLAMSGLRLGEGLALRWRDVDFDMNAIRVERTWSRVGGFTEPKTRTSRRAVVLLPSLADTLREYYQGGPPDALLFSHDGRQPLDPGNTRRRFYAALNAAELKHVTIHSLRHTYASVLLASGASIVGLQRSLGHASAVMTLDVYSHLLEESVESSALKADQLFTGAEGTLVRFQKRESGENR